MPILPGITPCLKCIYPEEPVHWKRKFPVLGAVSALVAQVGVIEGIKLLCDFDNASLGKLVRIDASSMNIRKIKLIPKREDCIACS